jgi:hypothetical protein
MLEPHCIYLLYAATAALVCLKDAQIATTYLNPLYVIGILVASQQQGLQCCVDILDTSMELELLATHCSKHKDMAGGLNNYPSPQ